MTLYSSIVKGLAFPLAQLLTKNGFNDYYKFLMKSQWYSKEELEKLQLKKIKFLLNHAYENVPMYKKIYKESGINPDDIKSIHDMRKIPVITKDDFREHYPGDCVAKNIPKTEYYDYSTSGSTGSPFAFFQSRELIGKKYARFFREMTWWGIEPGIKFYKIWGQGANYVPGKEGMQELFTKHILRRKVDSAFNMNSQKMDEYVDRIKRRRYRVVEAYTSAGYALAKHVIENRIDVDLDVMVVSGETLPDPYKDLISKAFNCKVYNAYGSREFGRFAHPCNVNKCLHYSMESFLLEFEKDNTPVMDEEGKILVTCFDNLAMPFIRYEIGDMAIPTEELCECGRKLKLLKKVTGRITEQVYSPSGRHISIHYLTLLFEEASQYVRYFQGILKKKDLFILNIVPTEKLTDEIAEKLRMQIQEHTGDDLKVEFNYVDKIPLGKNNKRILLKNNVKGA
jgi:phenylacetate-CoA ligase